MGVVSEGRVVQIAEMRHDSVDSTKESLVLLNHIQLVASTTETSDCFAEVLWQNLECSICLLSADEDFTDCRKKQFRKDGRCHLPLVLPLIIFLN